MLHERDFDKLSLLCSSLVTLVFINVKLWYWIKMDKRQHTLYLGNDLYREPIFVMSLILFANYALIRL